MLVQEVQSCQDLGAQESRSQSDAEGHLQQLLLMLRESSTKDCFLRVGGKKNVPDKTL